MGIDQKTSVEPRTTLKPVIIAILVGFSLVAIPLAYSSLMDHLDENKYRALFLKMPEVQSVENYLNYEGTRYADIRLRNGGFLHLEDFDQGSFGKTDFIGVKIIGDRFILCSGNPDRGDGTANGFNIIEVLRHAPTSPPIENIGDLVSRYDEIYGLVKKTVPDEKSRPKAYRIRSDARWCRAKIDNSYLASRA